MKEPLEDFVNLLALIVTLGAVLGVVALYFFAQ